MVDLQKLTFSRQSFIEGIMEVIKDPFPYLGTIILFVKKIRRQEKILKQQRKTLV